MIRKFRETDCEVIIEVWFAASQVATPFLSDEFLAEERDNIRKIWLPKAETWVFEAEDFVAIREEYCRTPLLRPIRFSDRAQACP